MKSSVLELGNLMVETEEYKFAFTASLIGKVLVRTIFYRMFTLVLLLANQRQHSNMTSCRFRIAQRVKHATYILDISRVSFHFLPAVVDQYC